VGEVSVVNDDETDNYFLDMVARFPAVEEDEPPYRLIVSDYARL
jgi:D-lyxose ketol-isomerase